MKNIYDLRLHETCKVETKFENGFKMSWDVIRTHSGWIYIEDNPRITRNPISHFVPRENGRIE